VYTSEELREAFAALIQQRHSEIRDAGKEITKLLSSSNRVLKVHCSARIATVMPGYMS
jgi:dynein heavy chain